MNQLTDPEFAYIKSAYICGPITDMPNGNKEAFFGAAEEINKLGINPVNPAELDEAEGLNTAELSKVMSGGKKWAQLLQRDLPLVLEVDAVVALEGWRNSSGAKLEIYVAASLAKPVFDARTLEVIPIGELPSVEPAGTILDHAKRRTSPERREELGHPIEDCTRIAGMLSAALGWRVTPEQVPMIMMVIKFSRYIHTPKGSTLADIAGYAQVESDIAERLGGFHKIELQTGCVPRTQSAEDELGG